MTGEEVATRQSERVLVARASIWLGVLIAALCACDTRTTRTVEIDECAQYFASLSTCFGPEVAARVRSEWPAPPMDESQREQSRATCSDASKRLHASCR